MSKIVHYYPDALVVFVKSFKEIPTDIKQEDLLIASGQAKEIVSVSITMTVGQSPSTFSLTLNDVANKFSFKDDPVREVINLRANSELQVKRDREQRGFKAVKGGVSYYEFDGISQSKTPWDTFEHGVLEDTTNGYRAVMYYHRLPSGVIAKRWAFDIDGRLIDFSAAYGEDFFTSPTSSGTSVLLTARDTTKPRSYIFYKFKNSLFLDKYQADVPEPLKIGRCRIEPMDRIAIFLSERFVQTSTGNYEIMQMPKNKLVRAFTGLVNTVQMGYADNGNTVTVNGEDVTKWMRLSVVPVSPSILTDDQAAGTLRFAAADNSNFNIYTNIFQSIRTPDLIKLLTVGVEGLEDDARKRLHGLDKVGFRGIGYYSAARSKQTNNQNIVYNVETSHFEVKQNGKDRATVSVIDFKGMLGTLFTKSSVHVIDPTQKGLDVYEQYNTNFQLPQTLQTEFQNRREICYKAATDSNFNFYADRNGHIWFHPPRYSNAWILTQKNDKLYIMDEDSIISFGFVEDDTNVYSTAVVSSEPDTTKSVVGTEADKFNRGAYTDELIMHKFGTKIITMSNPFIAKLGGASVPFASEPAIFYAKAMLQKLLANKLQGQITITGRAELDPGFPIYIPFRNMIYWVETVEHSLSFGGRYDTTLHLSYGRKPWESIAEIITQSFDQIHSGDGHIEISREPSTNQPRVGKTNIRVVKSVKEATLPPDKPTTPVVKPWEFNLKTWKP